MSNYDTEIHGNWLNDTVIADIKYPCGELVAGWECKSFVEAGRLIDKFIKKYPFNGHDGCRDEYCLAVNDKLGTKERPLRLGEMYL